MSVTLLNTNASLSGKTVVTAEGADTITGLKTFTRNPSAPFAVSGSSAVVPNLDADKLDGRHSGDFVLHDGTVAMTGTLSLGAIGKIQFPAAHSASAGVNVLDDYEEGSWTPVIGGSGGTSGQTYSTQVGRYIKIGKLVWATYSATLSVEGTITTSVQIQGLPFTSANVSGVNPIGGVQWNALAIAYVNIFAVVLANTTVANIRGITAASVNNVTDLTAADIGATTSLVGTIVYQAEN